MHWLEPDPNLDGPETKEALLATLKNNEWGGRVFGWFITTSGTLFLLLQIVAAFRKPSVIKQIPAIYWFLALWFTSEGPLAVKHASTVKQLTSGPVSRTSLPLINKIKQQFQIIIYHQIIGLVGVLVLAPVAIPVPAVVMFISIKSVLRDRDALVFIENQIVRDT